MSTVEIHTRGDSPISTLTIRMGEVNSEPDLNFEEEDVADLTPSKGSELRRRRKKEKKSLGKMQRQRSESEIREELGLGDLSLSTRALIVIVVSYAVMAGIGGAMQVASQSSNRVLVDHVQANQNLDVSVTREVFIAACEATWMATKLWTRLIWAILLPTSHQTFRITQDGFSAMQPSLRASIQLLMNLHWTTKVAIAGAVTCLVLVFMLQREIRRRRYRERTVEWFEQKNAAVHAVYDSVASSIRTQSRILADALPHLLFLGFAGTVYALGRTQFVEFSRGLGGWSVVIGVPVILATRALIVYDMAYHRMMERFHGLRRRNTFSQLPTAEMAQRQEFVLTQAASSILSSWLPTGWFGSRSQRSSTRRHNRQHSGGDAESEDDTSSIGSLDSQDISTVDGIHYSRQLELDPEASLELYAELQSVRYWVQYWTVLGLALFLEAMPVSGHLLSALSFWPPVRLMWSLWLQMPGTSGADLSFRWMIPLIDQLIGRVETPGVSSDQQSRLVDLMYAFRIISPETRAKFSEVMETGGTLVVMGLVFLVMPSTITAIGAHAIGLGRPVLTATRTLIALERAEKITQTAASNKDSTSLKRFRNNPTSIAYGAVQMTQWLQYWVVYTVSMLFHHVLSMGLFWFPLWNHMLLVFTLWLQLPYFRGANKIFEFGLKVFYKIRAYFIKDGVTDTHSSVKRGEQEPLSARSLPPIEENEAGERRALLATPSKRVSGRMSQTSRTSSSSSKNSRASGKRSSRRNKKKEPKEEEEMLLEDQDAMDISDDDLPEAATFKHGVDAANEDQGDAVVNASEQSMENKTISAEGSRGRWGGWFWN